jgi:hypothetical protein
MSYLYKHHKQVTMSTTNINHPLNKQQTIQKVSTNIVNNSGTVNMFRYLDIGILSSQPEDEEMLKMLDTINQHSPKREKDRIQNENNETINPHDIASKDNPQNNTTVAAASPYMTSNRSPIFLNPFGSAIGRRITFKTPYARRTKQPQLSLPNPKITHRLKTLLTLAVLLPLSNQQLQQ